MLRYHVRLTAAAAAVGVPAAVVGLVGAPAALIHFGVADPSVRTVTVDPPPVVGPTGTDDLAESLLEGAHPVVRPVAREIPGGGDRRGLPVHVSGTALPARVLLAYRTAAADLRAVDPGCQLEWSLLAGIGKVESGHASGGAVDKHGWTLSPILGPVLDGGPGVAAIADTDDGRFDGDQEWDRAVGPMQFIPSSWAAWGVDGDGGGPANPSDVDDAAAAAAGYLCAGDRDLRKERDRRAAIFSYNHSWDYVDIVSAWADAYALGTPMTTDPLPRRQHRHDNRPDGPVDGPGAHPPAREEPRPDAGSAPAAGAAPASAAPVEATPAPTALVGSSTPVPVPAATSSTTPPPTSTTPACPTPSGTGEPSPTGSPTAGTETATATPTLTPTLSPTGTSTGTPSPTDPAATCPPTSTPTSSATSTP